MKKTFSTLLVSALVVPMFMFNYEAQTGVAQRYLRGTILSDVERSQGVEALAEYKEILPKNKYLMMLTRFNRRTTRNMHEIDKYVKCTVTDVGRCKSRNIDQKYYDSIRSL